MRIIAVRVHICMRINVLCTTFRYYFDGQGKAIRPVIAMTLGHAFNQHFLNCSNREDISTDFLNLQRKQRQVSIISEMIHTASLVHDDILDKADTRRGKVAVNQRYYVLRFK